jgi:hypothetical protein
MPLTTVEKIWMDGELVDWADAKIHVLTHTLHYGCGVFEGSAPTGPPRARPCSDSPTTSSACSAAPRSS